MKFNEYSLENEEQILKFWKSKKIVDHLRKRNKQGDPFYFLDGPPYTSGKIHLGHAWNKSLKDMVLRYKRLQGFDVWDRAGFDMHGLPTEHKVMAKFNLKTKEDIKKFGYDKFSNECYNFCIEMMDAMIVDFERIGTTLDYSDPDQPIKPKRIEKVWSFIKKAHNNERLYLGKRALHWDPKDGSALAKHELEYKDITDDSIYLKFKIKGTENEHLLIWTTTPWTIPLNLMVVLHPDYDYVKCKVGEEVWIVAEKLAEKVIKEVAGKEFEIIETVKGSTFEGLEYTAPFEGEFAEVEEVRKTNSKIYSVLMSPDAVHLDEGTGLVHMAPGCGDTDYELCLRNGVQPFNPINEYGVYPDESKLFAGLVAKKDDAKFIELMEENGSLIAKKKIRHSYPHGERSKAAVIFRTTEQWFLKVNDLKEKMLANNEKVYWNPEAGKNGFRSWLSGLRDNSITKQRFWGTPVPIWQADGDKDDIIVIGSIEELKELASKETPVPENLHKPWIDDGVLEKDGKKYYRLPDVLDVWIDPGCQSWIMLDNEENMDRFYPPNFIVEGKDQIRAWFNLLWTCSHIDMGVPSFENVYMHGFVTDVDGVKMSKSIGNIISPYEVIDKHGADVLRLYMIGNNAGEDANFSWEELIVKERFLKIIWNVHKLLISNSKEAGVNPFEMNNKLEQMETGLEEKYILSRLQSTIATVTEMMNKYQLDKIGTVIESLFFDLSREYIQMSRDQLATGSKEEKAVVLATIAEVLFGGLKMLQVLCPFSTEIIFLNLKEEFTFNEESISHFAWPQVDNNLHNSELESQMAILAGVLQAGLNAREKVRMGLRWPMKELVVVSSDDVVFKSVEAVRDLLKAQLNVKDVTLLSELPGVSIEAEINMRSLGPKYGKNSVQVIKHIKSQKMADIISTINSEGNYSFKLIDGSEAKLVLDDFTINREVPKGFSESGFKGGFVYLNLERSPALEAEGYAREIMRAVQNQRKEAGLEKTDSIVLHVQVPDVLENDLKEFESMIARKVGADKLLLAQTKAARSHKHVLEFNVKKQSFVMAFDKV